MENLAKYLALWYISASEYTWLQGGLLWLTRRVNYYLLGNVKQIKPTKGDLPSTILQESSQRGQVPGRNFPAAASSPANTRVNKGILTFFRFSLENAFQDTRRVWRSARCTRIVTLDIDLFNNHVRASRVTLFVESTSNIRKLAVETGWTTSPQIPKLLIRVPSRTSVRLWLKQGRRRNTLTHSDPRNFIVRTSYTLSFWIYTRATNFTLVRFLRILFRLLPLSYF